MNQTLLELLDEKDIRDYAGYQIFNRGTSYYGAGRVEVETVTDNDARCRVRGTRYYYVKLWNHSNELGVTCTCPHAKSGWFCKHMVAAGLAVRDYLIRYGHTSWKVILTNTIQEGLKIAKRKPPKPYWLFFSLQLTEQGWALSPYRLWANRVPRGVIPLDQDLIAESLPELVAHNHWLIGYIHSIRTEIDSEEAENIGPDAVAFANILLNQDKSRQSYYGYYDAFPTGEYLSLLSQMDIPLYIGNANNPVRKHLRILPGPGEIILRIEQIDDGIQLALDLVAGGQVIHLAKNHGQVLTRSKPYWIMAGDVVLEIDEPFTFDRLASWLRAPEITIPREQENDFLENYFPALATQFPLAGYHIHW